MLRILHNTHFDFVGRTRAAAIGIAVFLLPALVMILISGFRTSVEFTGGTLMQVAFKTAPAVGDVRAAVAAAGIPNVEIQTFGSPNELVLRAQESQQVQQQAAGAETVAKGIRRGLDERFGAGSYSVVRTEGIGPRVGSELRQQALIAMLISFAITLIYLAWRFEWRFSTASVLATVHDIVATLALVKYLDLEISLFVVGGILTVIGYSLNDKVVVFDRVRENLRTRHTPALAEVLNRSINETLPRTVMTGSCTLATLLALLIFGGDVIRPFAWVLTFGILVGTFSSIYVAAPILLWIERKWPRAGEASPRSGSRSTTTASAAAADPRAASRTARPARAQ